MNSDKAARGASRGKRARCTALAGAGLAAVLAIGTADFPARAQDAPGGVTNVQISAEGKQVYEQICQSCHMADARGSGAAGDAGAKIPALADNARLADPKYPVVVLVRGKGAMPWFTEILTPAQMAAVVTYVRGHFNRYPDPVTEADVIKMAASAPPVADCNTCSQ